jgi:exosortase/archaeosortase family protein
VNRHDHGFLTVLALLAAFIWLRDIRWASDASNVLPCLAALPLFVWLGRPWHLRRTGPFFSNRLLIIAVSGFALGIGLNLTFLLALSWTTLLWSWLSVRLTASARRSAGRLLVLVFLAFPWITLDAGFAGWWFRISGAEVVAKLFLWGGFDVLQEGTNLRIQGWPISVEAPCSGLNALQSMLIAGTALASLRLRDHPWYWWNLPFLVVLAWTANTLRIALLSASLLTWGPEFTSGPFHEWSGWAILMLMFLLCWPVFGMQAAQPQRHAS